MPHRIHTLDLNFLGVPNAIASYLVPYAHGAVLVESGPGSTRQALQAGLAAHGFTPADVTDVLLTHIHLDHAGAAGWLACQGARIHVHHVGAPHLINPEKLLSSARRIYGEDMDRLWGEFLPVPEGQVSVLQDNDRIEIGDLSFQALDTPGHANHHMAFLFEDLLFSGDVGGVRMPGLKHLRLPMPPPEFLPGKWRESLERLSRESFKRIAPTHFGEFTDVSWHLAALAKALDNIEAWMDTVMPSNPALPELNQLLQNWVEQTSLADGVNPDQQTAFEASNPSWMSSQGIQRYWNKFRVGEPK